MNTPTKEPTETQRALASCMLHLLTAGHPKHVEAGALRLIVEHDAVFSAIIEKKNEALSYYADKVTLSKPDGWDYFGMGRGPEAEELIEEDIGEPARNALLLTPASMVSKLNEYRETACKYGKSHNEFVQVSGCDTAKELSVKLEGMVSKLAELEKERDRFKAIAAEGRKAGREEAVRIIVDRWEAEEGPRDLVHSSPMGDTGDYSTHWLEDKLREFFDAGPGAMTSRLDELEALYWEMCGSELDDDALKEKIAEQDAELARLREENTRLTHKVITCGVAASHPDANLTRTGAYASDWDSPQAESVRALRARAERLADAGEALIQNCDRPEAEWNAAVKGWRAALADQPAQANTQLAALIAAGDVYRRNADPEVYAENNARWDAAKQGAQPVENLVSHSEYMRGVLAEVQSMADYLGVEIPDHLDPAKHPVAQCLVGAIRQHSELAALREDRDRLDWLDDNAGYTGGGSGGVYSFHTPADVESGMIRAAIDAAMKGVQNVE